MLLRQSELLKLNGFWHFKTKPIRLKCPMCLLDANNPRRIPVCKNVKSLVRHISDEHKGEYWTEECKLILKKLAVALDSGLIVN